MLVVSLNLNFLVTHVSNLTYSVTLVLVLSSHYPRIVKPLSSYCQAIVLVLSSHCPRIVKPFASRCVALRFTMHKSVLFLTNYSLIKNYVG